MGPKKNKRKEVIQTDPWGPVRAPLEAVAGRIGDAAMKFPLPAFTGDFVAQGDADLNTRALESRMAAGTAAQGGATNLEALLPQLQNPFTIDRTLPREVPQFGSYDASAIRPVVDAAIHPVFRNLMETALPGIRSSALDAGAYSGTQALGNLPELALRNTTDEASRIATGLAYQDFSDWRNLLPQFQQTETNRASAEGQLNLNRMGLMPDIVNSALQARTGASDIFTAAADERRNIDQLGLNNEIARREYAVRAPFEGLDYGATILAGLGKDFGTQTNTITTKTGGGFGSVLQGALGVAGMVGGLPVGPGMSLGGKFLGGLFKKGT